MPTIVECEKYCVIVMAHDFIVKSTIKWHFSANNNDKAMNFFFIVIKKLK